MHRSSPLSGYPSTTLQAVRTVVAALLKYRDLLPTDLSTKLDLLHGDINTALRRAASPAPASIPHPAPPRPVPGRGQQALPHPSPPRDAPPPERRPR
jgi:hypothetical protein